jgi:hypothetical protein
MPKRALREITLAGIEQQFQLVSYWWFGPKWCPAVYPSAAAGYGIRVLKSVTGSGDSQHFVFDYFELGADGTVEVAPRGYAKQFKPGRVVDIEAAAARYATPDPNAMRIGGAA